MNQYPAGLVPMMMPQQYMVVPGAMQLPPGVAGHPHPHGALQPAAMLHHQQMAAQAAASHAAGAPVITSPVVTSAGVASALALGHQGVGTIAGLHGSHHIPGVGAPVMSMGGPMHGLHQAVPGGVQSPFSGLTPLTVASPLASGLLTHQQQHQQQQQQHPQHAASPQLQHLQGLQQASPLPQQLLAGQDYLKKEQDKSYGNRGVSNRWQTDPELDVEELNLDESLVVLDHFNSDLNLVIDSDGYGGTVLNNPPGFCFTWAGARATYGVCRGKAFFEVHILEHLPVNFGDDHEETDPHIIRVGWSIDSSSFQLGEEPWSFGYGGTGKFSTNNRFSDYGVRFTEGDVIGAMLDLDSRPASISFMKNGTWYGVAAPLHGFPVGSKEMALFPHILSKNCRFKVNFGQQDAWFPPPMGYRYIGHLQLLERVRGMTPPARKSDCEMIMIVGLPGAGKTTWAINMSKGHPEKRYNIIGTDTLIDKMRVMGLPRKRNYAGRWDVLIEKATKCLNKLFTMAAKRKRNYILDQTNVYGSARRRKMKNFTGFYRIAACLQPDDPELERRSKKRTQEDGKVVPESAVLEMKANYSLPEDRDNLFDRIDFVELPKEAVSQLVRQYNSEGKLAPRQDGSQSRFDNRRDQRSSGGYSGQGYGRSDSYNGRQGQSDLKRDHWGASDQDDVPNKRMKTDPGSALDLLKQQYEEDDRSQPSAAVIQQASLTGRAVAGVWPPDMVKVKEEVQGQAVATSQWPPTSALPPGFPQGLIASHHAAAALQPGLLGAPPLPPGVQLAFLPPGMPPPPPSELAGLGLAKTSEGHPSQQPPGLPAHLMQQAQQGQLLVDPAKLAAGSPFTLVSQATGQSLYGAAAPGFEAAMGQDRNAWQHASAESAAAAANAQLQHAVQQQQQAIQQHQQQQQAAAQQQQSTNWPQEPEEGSPQSKPWQQQDRSSSGGNWHSDWQKEGRDRDKRGGGGGRDSFSRPDSRDRERDRDRDRDRERDRDRGRDRDYGSSYSRNKGGDRDRFSSSDRRDNYGSRDHSSSDRGGSSWNYSGSSSSTIDRQDYGSDSGQKSERQRRRKSKWDQPGDEERATDSTPVKTESSDRFGDQAPAQSIASLFSQPPPGFPSSSSFSGGPPPFSAPSSQSSRQPSVSLTTSLQGGNKPQMFEMNLNRPPPPLLGNIKTEFSTPSGMVGGATSPDIKLPVSGSGDGLLGQGPGPRPLIPGLQGSMGGQFRPRGAFPGPPPFRGSDNNMPRPRSDSGSGPRKPFSPEPGKNNDDSNSRPGPKPLISLDDKGGTDKGDNKPGNPPPMRGGPGKPGLFPTPGTPEAEGPGMHKGPPGPPFRPRGPPGLMGRFPGAPDGPPPMGGPGMLGPGPPGPPPGMGPRPPRGGPMGPRGPPPPGGPMGGPPMGPRPPMGGPPRGPPRGPGGPGPWNGNRPPRFGPRGPQGPPRPLFDGPPGRWPRPPR